MDASIHRSLQLLCFFSTGFSRPALSALRTEERFRGVLQPVDVKDVLADSVLLTIASMQARSKSFSSGRKGMVS